MSETVKSKKALEGAIGQRFGRLTVVEITGQSTIGKQKRRIVRCICDCGNEKLIPLTYLRRGHTNSCGCKLLETSMSNIKLAHKKLFDDGTWGKDPQMISARKVWIDAYSDGDLSLADFMILSQQNCFYCGKLPSNCRNAVCDRNSEFRKLNGNFIYSGLDRVNNNLGHMKDNVVPCCIDCNKAKCERSQDEFLEWIKIIYNKQFRSSDI